MKMLLRRHCISLYIVMLLARTSLYCSAEIPHRILLDTDVDTDDLFALLYLLKLNRSQFDLQAVTINTNEWTNAGHAVNHIYDILYMMGRDDIPVGVGGEGGILNDGTIQPNVGGYLPIIDQGRGTAGPCRYRQSIPVGSGGRLDIDTNFGFRKSFLPQGSRKYTPIRQPTSQQVMINTISSGLTTVFIIGSHTNLAIFLMKNPHLKKNVEHIYVMGGGVRSENPTGCCPKNSSSTCQPKQCGDRGNLFTGFKSNPYAEFNIFGDPFAAYQISFMWDSFAAGVATSIMKNMDNPNGENEFAVMEYINITVVTSNKPYGISDGSNPFFDGLKVAKFNLTRNGVHSGHVQTGIHDPYCIGENGIGICQDGYTKEVTGPDSVRVLVATKAKPNRNNGSTLDREFFVSFLQVLNLPENSGRFNFTNQFPYYKEVHYKPDFGGKKLGKDIVFDMDMSAGDFLALLYLLKSPVDLINLKAIFVTPTGWTSAATIDVVYDVLHMMGRDDIPVGLGDVFGLNQSDAGCKYTKAMPHGAGGFLDSDTLYGLARDLPRSPRRYTAENSVEFGASRDTEFPELRQPRASEVWQSIIQSLDQGSKVTILTNGPLTTIANILLSDNNTSSFIQDVFIVGGHIKYNNNTDRGNVINVPSNQYTEINLFLDPSAAMTVFGSDLNITLIPLAIQRKVSVFPKILEKLDLGTKTPEALFARRLLARLFALQQKHHRYQHLDTFLGEILGSVIVAGDDSILKSTFQVKQIKVFATGLVSKDGEIIIDEKQGKPVKVLEELDCLEYYQLFASRLGDKKQSAVIGSFYDQTRIWSTQPTKNESRHG